MRNIRSLALPALVGLALLSGCSSAYRADEVSLTARFGTGIDLYGYYPDRYGDWRTSYQQWAPVVVYEYQGRYYPSPVRGARQVQVYRSQSGYFLPPRDTDWSRTERRFDRKKMPDDRDYGRARPRPDT